MCFWREEPVNTPQGTIFVDMPVNRPEVKDEEHFCLVCKIVECKFNWINHTWYCPVCGHVQ